MSNPTIVIDKKLVSIIEIPCDQNATIEIEKKTVVIEFPNSVVINNAAIPGAADITSVVCTFEAGAAINVNRAVSIGSDGRIIHSDKDDPENPFDVVGVSRQSGATGQFVEVVKFGKLTGAAFGLPPEDFFLGNNGLILNVVSPTGTYLSIGTQLNASEFFVNIGEPIRRN